MKLFRWSTVGRLASSVQEVSNQQQTRSAEMQSLLRELDNLCPRGSPTERCLNALSWVEEELLNRIREAAESLLDCIQSSLNQTDAILVVESLGGQLRNFLIVTAERYRDTVNDYVKEEVGVCIQGVRTILPYLTCSLEEASLPVRAFLLNHLKTLVLKIVNTFERNFLGRSKIGYFVEDMNWILDFEPSDGNFVDLVETGSRILKFGTQVSQLGSPHSQNDISTVSKEIVEILNSLKNSNSSPPLDSLKDMFEELEQKVNIHLLTVVCRCLGSADSPLENLLLQLLNSKVEEDERSAADLREPINRLDLQTDMVIGLCEVCAACTRDKPLGNLLISAFNTIQLVEPELVPAVIQMYLQPNVPSHRRMVRFLRQLWRTALDLVLRVLKRIVDPAAITAIILKESKKIGNQIFENLYLQDVKRLRELVFDLVGMCELGVDVAWTELGKADAQVPLADTHPVVKTERAVWEVRGAAKILMGSPEDLDLHKSLSKRIKILLNNLAQLSAVLFEEERDESSRSKILGDTLRKDLYKLTADMTSVGEFVQLSATRSEQNNGLESKQEASMETTHMQSTKAECRKKLSAAETNSRQSDDVLCTPIRNADVPSRKGRGVKLVSTPEERSGVKLVFTPEERSGIKLVSKPEERSGVKLVSTPESSARMSSVMEQLEVLSMELSFNLEKQTY